MAYGCEFNTGFHRMQFFSWPLGGLQNKLDVSGLPGGLKQFGHLITACVPFFISHNVLWDSAVLMFWVTCLHLNNTLISILSPFILHCDSFSTGKLLWQSNAVDVICDSLESQGYLAFFLCHLSCKIKGVFFVWATVYQSLGWSDGGVSLLLSCFTSAFITDFNT